MSDVKDESTEAKPDEQLGNAGKKALDAERKARREAEKALREAQDRIDKFERWELLREVAASKDLTEDQAARLNGSTKEELEADADALLKAFGKTPDNRDAKSHTRRPKEALKSGAAPDAEAPPDVSKIADRVFDRGI